MVPEDPNVKSTATSSSSSKATAISGKAWRSDEAAYTSIVFSGPETERTTATTATTTTTRATARPATSTALEGRLTGPPPRRWST